MNGVSASKIVTSTSGNFTLRKGSRILVNIAVAQMPLSQDLCTYAFYIHLHVCTTLKTFCKLLDKVVIVFLIILGNFFLIEPMNGHCDYDDYSTKMIALYYGVNLDDNLIHDLGIISKYYPLILPYKVVGNLINKHL